MCKTAMSSFGLGAVISSGYTNGAFVRTEDIGAYDKRERQSGVHSQLQRMAAKSSFGLHAVAQPMSS
jgi:hypothetical protein